MRLTPRLYLVGSGEVGISDPGDCHVYLLDGGDEYALIDAGCGTERSVASILANLEREGLDPMRLRKVILTHWHGDHASGASIFRERLGCRVVAPAGERAFLEEGRGTVRASPVDHPVEDGEEIAVGTLRLTARCVPGHSEATTAYQVQTAEGRLLFCGDIVFANGIIGLINHPGSDLARYREHIGRLGGLGIDALLPGHLLFTLGDGQRHLDLAIRRLTTGGFVPYSIGQSAVSFLPPAQFE
jgi:glyoxylase-like metal-dependent hydrolase (beta-lactamase superfamily II)